MSSPLINSGRPQNPASDWAVRLIPGVGADIGKGAKKQPQSVRINEMLRRGQPIEETGGASKKIAGDFTRQPMQGFMEGLREWNDRPRRNVLIVGAGAFGRRIASSIEQNPEQGRVVCGFLDDRRPMGNGVIGRTSNLARLSRTSFIDEVILAAPNDREMTLEVLREARRLHLDVEMAVDLFGCDLAQAPVHRLGEFPVFCLNREPLPVGRLVAKRCVDLLGAVVGLFLLTPAFAVIAGLIKWDSAGPVVYSAQRVGRKGKPFRCYKFRTMVSNADGLKAVLRTKNERSGAFFKIADDPRITRAGRWLRRYSLDELPQLWNVVRGEMSLVGPRPHPLDDFAAYSVEHLARLDVTPGITGLWQVTARRDPSFEKGVELDREYIETWNLTMDLRILFKTVLAVFRGSGA